MKHWSEREDMEISEKFGRSWHGSACNTDSVISPCRWVNRLGTDATSFNLSRQDLNVKRSASTFQSLHECPDCLAKSA